MFCRDRYFLFVDSVETVVDDENDKYSGGLSDLTNDKDEIMSMRHLTRLVSDMSKYTILITIAIISTFISFLTVSLIFFAFDDNTRNNIFSFGIAKIIFSIDSLINCICLSFQFRSFKKDYLKFCNKFHRQCEDRYTNETNKHNDTKLQRLASGELGFKIDHDNNHDGITDMAGSDNVFDHDKNINGDRDTTNDAVTEINMLGQKSASTLDA